MARHVSTAYGEDTHTDDASDPNRIVQCPYDKNHQIRASRFPFHVLKCRKVGKRSSFVSCIYINCENTAALVLVLWELHLSKLFQNHPKLAGELKTCPFNARHLIPKHELSHHITNCEDKRSLSAEDGLCWAVAVSLSFHEKLFKYILSFMIKNALFTCFITDCWTAFSNMEF